MPSFPNLLEECVSRCGGCLHACLECASELSTDADDAAGGACMLRLLDCAQACEAAVGFMVRCSPLADEMCALCGEICETCATNLERTYGSHPCADACRKCADACFDVWSARNAITGGVIPDGTGNGTAPELAHASIS